MISYRHDNSAGIKTCIKNKVFLSPTKDKT